MNTSLRFLSSVSIFLILMALVFDMAQINHIKRDIKDSLDLSTKAAALQLDEDPIKIGQGIFEINEIKAKNVNTEIFYDNIIFDSENINLITTIINTHTTTTYKAPNNKSYLIDSPTIFSVATYKYDGFFINKEITVNLLSASVLKNKNNLKNNF